MNSTSDESFDAYLRDETSVWASEVNHNHVGYFIYILVVPIFCIFGIITNSLNAIIFSRPRMVSSSYVYFTALSCLDLLSCLLLFLSCLARTRYWMSIGWRKFDLFGFLPISGITTTASNFITLAVVIDRVIYMKTCLPKGAPKYCSPSLAKKVIPAVICVCVFINFPYFFIFNEVDGRLRTSAFFETIWYNIYNWIKFSILILSSIILIVSNGMMIAIMRKWYKSTYLIRCGTSTSEKKQLFSQTQLTLTIIVVVFLFLIGEIPMYLASRRSAITMLFQGDLSKSSSQALETFRIIATFLHALHISLNIAIYTSLNPPYIVELFDFLQIICSKCHWKVFSNNTAGGSNISHKINSHSFETNICIIHGISEDSSMAKKSFKVNNGRASNYRICTCRPTLTTTAKKEMIEIENNDYVEILPSRSNVHLESAEICLTKNISVQYERDRQQQQHQQQNDHKTIDIFKPKKMPLSGIEERISNHKSLPAPTITKSENHLK